MFCTFLHTNMNTEKQRNCRYLFSWIIPKIFYLIKICGNYGKLRIKNLWKWTLEFQSISHEMVHFTENFPLRIDLEGRLAHESCGAAELPAIFKIGENNYFSSWKNGFNFRTVKNNTTYKYYFVPSSFTPLKSNDIYFHYPIIMELHANQLSKV